jgi:RNA polymerase sigma-70 factor (ECF subfamily)
MPKSDDDTEVLLACVAQGQAAAAETLLSRHRDRLASMVRLRMDPRLGARLDASDVVQEALYEAHRRLPQFAHNRPMPFYPWLRNIAWERLIELHRRHVIAQQRSVVRETRLPLPEGSEALLAERLAASANGVSALAVRAEVRHRVRAAIAELPPPAQEIVILRHLEELPFKEITAVLGISPAAVYSRYRRAVEQLAVLLKAEQ